MIGLAIFLPVLAQLAELQSLFCCYDVSKLYNVFIIHGAINCKHGKADLDVKL